MSVINLKMQAMLSKNQIKSVDLAAFCGLSFQTIENIYHCRTTIEEIRLKTIIAIYEGTQRVLGQGWAPWDYLEVKKWK